MSSEIVLEKDVKNNKTSIIYHFFKDKDFFNTFLNQGSKLITGPLLLLIIPLFITKIVQGYWFSFMSISALSILADLGFTIIILQFSAHEFAHLRFKEQIIVPINVEKIDHLYRLASLLKFTISWLIKLIIITFPIIFIIGFLLFNKHQENVNWHFPWVIYTIASALVFVNNVILSFIEGCDSVSDIQRIRFYNTILNFGILFPLLILKFDLFSISIALLFSAILTSLIIYSKYHKLIFFLYRIAKNYTYNWFEDFWSYFRGYSVSVISGFLLVQIYTPIAFNYYGPAAAGRVGLTMSLMTAIFSISNIWFQSIAPKANILASKKLWGDLEKILLKRLKYAIFTFITLILIFMSCIFLIRGTKFSEIEHRFLAIPGILILVFYWLIQIVIWAMAFYLRATKKEPFMVLSIFGSLLVLLLTFIFAKYFSVEYLFCGLLTVAVITFPIAYIIFVNRRKEWCS